MAIEIRSIGVAGAGTMGSGIAQLACFAGYDTVLQDPDDDALHAGEKRLRAALASGAERNRWSERDASEALGRLRTTTEVERLAGCDLVIEAAPERLELKRELFSRLSELGGKDVILATNTSSLPVSAIASASDHPERVCGMHFFNPPARMPLVEVIGGMDTDQEVVLALMEVGRRMDRTPIQAADAPGFLANRCARPFGLEALRLLGDGIGTHEQIDRICRMGAGFRMGPFELMDLVGIDVGFEVSKSFYEQSFNEPRWQPHPIQAQMAQAGRHGRKTGRGYYDYSKDEHRPADPEPPPASDGEGEVGIEVSAAIALDLRDRAMGAGYQVFDFTETGVELRLSPLVNGSFATRCATLDAVGFYILPPLGTARVVELVRGPETHEATVAAAERFFESMGLHHEWVGDAPGAILGRIVCQIVNEAAFALQRGIGSADDIDTAMRLGFNWPHGPLDWGDSIGLEHVIAVLNSLYSELREERYRIAPLLHRLWKEERWGRSAGRGFYSYLR